MSYRRNGRGLLGLLVVAVLGVMAFASSAQAAKPLFLVNKLTTLTASFGAVKDNGLEVLLVPGSNFEIKCPQFSVISGVIGTGGHSASISLLYEECVAFSITPLEELTTCHVSDVAAGKADKLHITAVARLLPVEFKDGTFGVLAEGITAFVNFLEKLGCPLPLKNAILGEVCFRITAGNDTAEPLIESDQMIQEECPPRTALEDLAWPPPVTGFIDLMKFGAKDAFIDGKAKLFGLGAHAGKTLGVSLL